MAEPAKDQDQSMEDILQSIKRIIAEEGDPEPQPGGSDVLELTERLAEDGSVTQVKPGEGNPSTMSIDEIMAQPISTPAPAPAPAVAPAPEPTPSLQVTPDEDSLISNTTLSASVAALNALRDSMTPAPPAPRADVSFRSGITVEDLVIESLKPMLKDWLDGNLPRIVEQLVRKEISKLSQN